MSKYNTSLIVIAISLVAMAMVANWWLTSRSADDSHSMSSGTIGSAQFNSEPTHILESLNATYRVAGTY